MAVDLTLYLAERHIDQLSLESFTIASFYILPDSPLLSPKSLIKAVARAETGFCTCCNCCWSKEMIGQESYNDARSPCVAAD